MTELAGFLHAVLTEQGVLALLVLLLIGTQGWLVRYLLTTHAGMLRDNIVANQEATSAFHALSESNRELRDEIRRKP